MLLFLNGSIWCCVPGMIVRGFTHICLGLGHIKPLSFGKRDRPVPSKRNGRRKREKNTPTMLIAVQKIFKHLSK